MSEHEGGPGRSALPYTLWVVGQNLALAVYGIAFETIQAWGDPAVRQWFVTHQAYYVLIGVVLGAVQAGLLWSMFGIRSWLWLPATVAGLSLHLMAPVGDKYWMGLVTGVLQAPLLIRRFHRFALAWPAASGVGLAGGIALAVETVQALRPPAAEAVGGTIAGTVYGLCTAAVLWLGSRAVPPPGPAADG